LEDTCSLCGGRGLLLRGEVAVPCGCTRKAGGFLRLPPRLSNCRFEDFHLGYYSKDLRDQDRGLTYHELARLALEAAREFCRDFGAQGDGLLLMGSVGSGKTLLAGAIANALLARGIGVSFVVVPEWLDLLRESYSVPREWRQGSHDLWETAREAPLLILDDLGAHNYTEWTLNSLYSVINYRFNHLLPLLVTTNLGAQDWRDRLGERTTSRLIQMCRACQLLVETDIRVVLRARREAERKKIRREGVQG